MNLILIFDSDFIETTKIVQLKGRRHKHIKKVLKASPGDTLKIGLLNDKTGTGKVLRIDETSVDLEITLKHSPPNPLPVKLILALPRPKVIKRVLQSVTAMGVKDIMLINAWRVEKSFWQSPVLTPGTLRTQLIYGLEQAKDTILPDIQIYKGFKPFVEDRVPDIIKGTIPIVAHPVSEEPCPRNLRQETTLAIGPEGGFIPYEIDKFVRCGFKPVHLGNRILKVETAIPAILGRLF